MAAGNLREDGSACDFGGCLFSRPDDRVDHFDDASGRLGLRFALADGQGLVARVARAFRVPQAGELYRLQRGQTVADLAAEVLDGVEFGWRGAGIGWHASVDSYAYRKRNLILRDAAGINVSDGRSRHHGVEGTLRWQPSTRWWLDAELAWSRQRYDFDRAAAAGEQIRRGNAIDTAPRWLGGARLGVAVGEADQVELEWRHQGSYFLDAANSARYPGHDLLSLRWQRQLVAQWSLSLRLMNLTDRRYAERADFAFGNFRYFPGAGRELFVALEWRGE
jgi:outer membrane receptor protein involved in Fe transport